MVQNAPWMKSEGITFNHLILIWNMSNWQACAVVTPKGCGVHKATFLLQFQTNLMGS